MPLNASHLQPAKGASIILDACLLDDHGNPARPADVWFEEIPAQLSIRGGLGITGRVLDKVPQMRAVGVSSGLDLDHGYLSAATKGANLIRLDISRDNWGYPDSFYKLPHQLRPFQVAGSMQAGG